MKYRLSILIAVLLTFSVVLLMGCSPDHTGEEALYWNADRGAERVPNADGSYDALFLLDGEQVTLRVPNEEMMKHIDAQEALGLTLDKNGTITDTTHIMDMPQYYLAFDYAIQSFNGNTVKVNSETNLNGRSVVFTYDESTKILDVSDFAATKGEPTVLQKGDGATVVANADGTINTIFINQRQGIFTTEKRYCPICEEDVDFTNWFSNVSMPFSSGHYYLEKDIELTAGTFVTSGEVTLDLNGKTVTMVNEGQRFYSLGEDVILNLMDTAGDGKAVVASSGKSLTNNGMFVLMEGYGCEFNMYSGTIDATDCVCDHGTIVNNKSGVFNLYGGTLLGGTTYGVGGGAVIVQSETNIYGGEIVGGYCADLDGYKNNPPGGGCIRHNGATRILNIYGGVIRGGSTDYNGGCIYINGPLNLYGGTITGGSAEEAGGGIYVGTTGSVNLSGDVTVTDNEDGDIYLSDGRTVTVGDDGLGNAKLGIAMAKPGTFTSNAVSQEDAACFSSSSGKIVRNSDGTLALK